jgi:hypothetical protein
MSRQLHTHVPHVHWSRNAGYLIPRLSGKRARGRGAIETLLYASPRDAARTEIGWDAGSNAMKGKSLLPPEISRVCGADRARKMGVERGVRGTA